MAVFFKSEKVEPVSESRATTSDRAGVIGRFTHQASGLGKESAELNGLIQDLAGMSSKQAETFKTLAAEIEAMVRANQAIEDATRISGQSVQRARHAVEQLGRDVIAVTDNLSKVDDAAKEITQIALQTRLVAFNASVEAKRAGDAGRGFGVVADAVKDLAAKVAQSSKLITSTIAELDARIKELADSINSKESHQKHGGGKVESFDTAVSGVEGSVADIAIAAKKNLTGCGDVLNSVRGLSAQVLDTASALHSAEKKTEGFLALSESLIEITAQSGIDTEDTPFIEGVIETGSRICGIFEGALASGRMSSADMFDDKHRLIPGTNPEQFMTRFTDFCDETLGDLLESILTWSPKISFAAVSDMRGYVPTHQRLHSQPQSADPVWNATYCRNRRFFVGRTEMAAIKSVKRFLLQTYRRDMGGGNFVVLKSLSVPIWVNGRHWGTFRIGYSF